MASNHLSSLVFETPIKIEEEDFDDLQCGDAVSSDVPVNVEHAEVEVKLEPSDENLQSGDVTSPNQCHNCGKCFSTKGNLKMHIRIHSNNKPHQCKFC